MTDAGVRLGLLRHGRTDWNRAHRLQGRVDRPLDPEGRAEIAAHRPPDDWRDAEIVTSPLRRAAETAELLAVARPVRLDQRLIEQDFGDWEGRRGVDLEASDPRFRPIEAWGWGYAPPGGESVGAVRDRLVPFLSELGRRGDGPPVLAVCHIGVIRVILALAHGWRFEGAPPFRVKRLRIHPVTIDRDGAPAPDGPPEPLVRHADREASPCA